MELIGYTPVTVKSHWLPVQETRLIPIGDIQYGASSDIDRLKRYLAWGMKQHSYFVGMGDYIDCASPSNRKLIGSVRSALYDSVRKMMDERVAEYVTEMCDILKPTKGKWMGLLTGHHTWEFEDGTTTESRLAQYLGCPLLGHCAMLVLRFYTGPVKRKSSKVGPWSQHVDAKIWLHHGSGGGRTEGAPFTLMGHLLKSFNANVFVMGHVHKKGTIPVPWIDVEMNRKGVLRTVGTTRYLVISGSFLRGYETGSRDPKGHPSGLYPEQKMLNPVALGTPIIMFRPMWSSESPGSLRVDVNVSV